MSPLFPNQYLTIFKLTLAFISPYIIELNQWKIQHSLIRPLSFISISQSWTFLREFLGGFVGGHPRLGRSYRIFYKTRIKYNDLVKLACNLDGSSFTTKEPADSQSKKGPFIAIELIDLYISVYRFRIWFKASEGVK